MASSATCQPMLEGCIARLKDSPPGPNKIRAPPRKRTCSRTTASLMPPQRIVLVAQASATSRNAEASRTEHFDGRLANQEVVRPSARRNHAGRAEGLAEIPQGASKLRCEQVLPDSACGARGNRGAPSSSREDRLPPHKVGSIGSSDRS